MVYLDQFEKKYKDKGLSILAVSIDSQKSLSQVRSYIRSKKYTFEVFQDPNSQTFKKLNGNLMPTNILINKDGKYSGDIMVISRAMRPRWKKQ
jgi:thiol-disulfide isomerase/thioredoxin